jgi:phosphotriesterase-related protein
MIETVNGRVSGSALGATLMHEHVIVMTPEMQQNFWHWDRESVINDAIQKLADLKAVGIDTIVDLTVLLMGRDVATLKEVARSSPLNVLVATGFYVQHDLPPYLRTRTAESLHLQEDPLVSMLVSDIREGIAGTGIKAAVIKATSDRDGLTHDVDRCLRAAARAHRLTGAPISTHSHSHSRGGLEQQRVFREEGVDLGRVVIGHSGDTGDVGYLEELIDQGSLIGMDRFGLAPPTLGQRADVVAQMCEKGYANRMVLSHDSYCSNDWIPAEMAAAQPDWNLLHISRQVLPALRDRGVSEQQLRQMLVSNPREFLDANEPY